MSGKKSEYWIEHLPALISETQKRFINGRMPLGGWAEVAKIFGKPSNACEQQYRRATESSPVGAVAQGEPARDAVAEEAERRDRMRRMREEQELLSAVAGEKSLRALLEALAEKAATRFTAPPAYRPPKPAKHTTRESMVMLLSDWHSAEVIPREGTRGHNEYNALITSQRARRNTINYWLISHFHSQSSLPQAAGEVFINESLCGGTEFTTNALGVADPPNQLMFGIHAEHGVTHRWPLYASTEPDAPSYDMGGWVIG